MFVAILLKLAIADGWVIADSDSTTYEECSIKRVEHLRDPTQTDGPFCCAIEDPGGVCRTTPTK